jgi:hypothetical protein
LNRPQAAPPKRPPPPRPPHDCRLTARCLRESFHPLKIKPGDSFERLRSENTVIDTFFERRQNDAEGGESGKAISQVRTRPVFGLTSGRMRGATWFDTEHPPQGVVWLLAVELHDDRHQGSSDAYDIFQQLENSGRLFPEQVDYQWLELDRRRLDTASFSADVRRDGRRLVAAARRSGRSTGTVANVPVRLAWEHRAGDLPVLYVAVSTRTTAGPRSGLSFPLTNERFLLIAEAVRQAGEALIGPEVVVDELLVAPDALGRRQDERTFLVIFERG